MPLPFRRRSAGDLVSSLTASRDDQTQPYHRAFEAPESRRRILRRHLRPAEAEAVRPVPRRRGRQRSDARLPRRRGHGSAEARSTATTADAASTSRTRAGISSRSSPSLTADGENGDMRVRANRELAEELFARLSAGDVAGTLAMLADDATWLAAGR